MAHHAPIAIDTHDIFQDKLMGAGIIAERRLEWDKAVKDKYFREESLRMRSMWKECGAYRAGGDYGHTSPNSKLLLQVGINGLLERVELAEKGKALSKEQADFYLSCKIALRSMIHLANRLSSAIEPYNEENAHALKNIACGAPSTLYEAMQLLILYFFFHDYIGGTRIRTLGRLDALLYPFYARDIERGVCSKEDAFQMLKFFLYKFWLAKVPYDLPFCLGGTDEDENEVTNELSYMIVEAYDSLNIYSPKIHVRVSNKTPHSFIKRILDCIRHGNSSFVFINENIGIESLIRVGISERDAKNFVPIGCYEPAVWGVEMGCSDNGGVSLPKAIELVFNNGRDKKSGILCGVPTNVPSTYEEFLEAVKQQIAHMTQKALDYTVMIEEHYREITPDPLLSAQYDYSVKNGVDVYFGGAKYNNSSMYFYSIASLVDSIFAVKRLVYDEKRYSFEELSSILKANWKGYEKERLKSLRSTQKFGNGLRETDELAKDISHFCAELVNNYPNGRGGVFKAAIYTTDFCFYIGERTMATPDGRYDGEPLSKNLCASVGMDRNGITALINSVTAIDHADFPTGSVLDILLHPSAVANDDGLDAFLGILLTYFKKGGFAMHGNIFDAETLKRAQSRPDEYKNLQVRVCGWNAYFVNLSKTEQDCFIRQAEAYV